MNLKDFTIKHIQQGLKKKEFSAQELIKAYLDRINKENKKIKAFLTVCDSSALSQAKQVDDLLAKGKPLCLSGIPIVVKDNILVKGIKCTAGSKILENYRAAFDATCIERLRKTGAIFLGKTNLDEFAMGSSTENSAFYTTHNPHDLQRVPGGSSGGSTAAVASNQCCCALGSDTGGSIRQPASFCGVVGLKPTYGAVSRYGLIAFASSLDQIGPIAKNVDDCQVIFDIIKGRDKNDSTSVDCKEEKKDNLKVGIAKEYLGQGIDKEVKQAILSVIEKTEKQGIKIQEISLPHTKYAIACYYLIAPSEASANLARYDGVRYGTREQGKDLLDVYLKTRGKGFGAEVKRRIMLGTYALSAGYYDAFYLKAQKVRTLIKQDFEKAFQKVDVIFTPTNPTLPFKIGEKIDDPLQMYLSDILNVSVNLAGLPGISLPVAKVNNLPVGLQIIGKPFQESQLFTIGRFIEKIL